MLNCYSIHAVCIRYSATIIMLVKFKKEELESCHIFTKYLAGIWEI